MIGCADHYLICSPKFEVYRDMRGVWIRGLLGSDMTSSADYQKLIMFGMKNKNAGMELESAGNYSEYVLDPRMIRPHGAGSADRVRICSDSQKNERSMEGQGREIQRWSGIPVIMEPMSLGPGYDDVTQEPWSGSADKVMICGRRDREWAYAYGRIER